VAVKNSVICGLVDIYVSKEHTVSSIRAEESATQEKKKFVTEKREQRLAKIEQIGTLSLWKPSCYVYY
jgi:hypothetical protein